MIKEKENYYPPFSVAMCVYGGDNPEWFVQSLNSVLEQSVPPDDLVLVVDGPISNELDEIIKEFELIDCVNVIRLKENVGHGNARREALLHCTNDLVALMDADDISVRNRFELQLNLFEKNCELDVVGGDIDEFVNDVSNVVSRRVVPKSHEDIIEFIKKRCPFNQMTVMFKKSAVQYAGGYLDWYCNEDYYLWIRMHLNKKQFANLDQVLVNVRVGEEMYQRRGGRKYFCSEAKLQKYMYDKQIINFSTFCMNIMKRFIVQVLLPNELRGWIFRKFARKAVRE